MKTFRQNSWLLRLGLFFTSSFVLMAQNPLEEVAEKMKDSFTGPLANAMILIAIVVSGATLAYSDGQGKRNLAGLIGGSALAVGAVRFYGWAFT
jgi:type IV secretory pathway VirB2 component (pilin)